MTGPKQKPKPSEAATQAQPPVQKQGEVNGLPPGTLPKGAETFTGPVGEKLEQMDVPEPARKAVQEVAQEGQEGQEGGEKKEEPAPPPRWKVEQELTFKGPDLSLKGTTSLGVSGKGILSRKYTRIPTGETWAGKLELGISSSSYPQAGILQSDGPPLDITAGLGLTYNEFLGFTLGYGFSLVPGDLTDQSVTYDVGGQTLKGSVTAGPVTVGGTYTTSEKQDKAGGSVAYKTGGAADLTLSTSISGKKELDEQTGKKGEYEFAGISLGVARKLPQFIPGMPGTPSLKFDLTVGPKKLEGVELIDTRGMLWLTHTF